MAKKIPVTFDKFDNTGKIVPVTWKQFIKSKIDEFDLACIELHLAEKETESMTCGTSRGFGQMMVNQTPRYDNAARKRKRRVNQVIGKAGIIRKDKRMKARYL